MLYFYPFKNIFAVKKFTFYIDCNRFIKKINEYIKKIKLNYYKLFFKIHQDFSKLKIIFYFDV